ncbi:unnamed protein product [Arabis nemorensis]|uniref:TIR domain-containing protein n=1 Tax=Arabis nemorensis TaxID=586526 RepID=A0A565BRE5_9BRAS|nr:unnamed protein product [Arabis nemorensis]
MRREQYRNSHKITAVAKALRGAAEGKALAQADAAEWKGRYELEKSRNLKLQHKECQNRQMEYLPRNSSMTISSPTQAHQVFLNYRGEQLRHNFISHLIDAFERHDINFVVDKYEQRGNDLKNLFVRIEESRIALAIFSTRYAESRWCMDELVKMKKLVDQEKLRVIPIFYKVKAQDVRGQEGEFGKNFWKLARKPSSSGDDIKNWKEALECISDKMGLSLRDKR